jgi:hypothetical protein
LKYSKTLTATENKKGVLDVDTVKGCSFGMQKYPDGGCYGLCYAATLAYCRGFDFHKSIVRKNINKTTIQTTLIKHHSPWFRVGTMGDPSYDWDFTIYICEWLARFKVPVIVTKHWINLNDNQITRLKKIGSVVNTSISPLDSKDEIKYRLDIFKRLKEIGLNSVLRIVSAEFGVTKNGRKLNAVQDKLFMNSPIIDNPLRIPLTDKRVLSGDIIVHRHKDAANIRSISVSRRGAYIGSCVNCPDQ